MANARKHPVSFLDLDYDIRLMIYRQLLIRPVPITFGCEDMPAREKTKAWPAQRGDLHVGLLLVCKQIYKEATLILYGQNTFGFLLCKSQNPRPRAERFLSIIGPWHAVYLTHVDSEKVWIVRNSWWATFAFDQDDHNPQLPTSLREDFSTLLSWCPRLRRVTFHYFTRDVETPLSLWAPQIRDILRGITDENADETTLTTTSKYYRVINATGFTHVITKGTHRYEENQEYCWYSLRFCRQSRESEAWRLQVRRLVHFPVMLQFPGVAIE
jgi:hypothetical protein